MDGLVTCLPAVDDVVDKKEIVHEGYSAEP
jgi:hypothetical protein